MYVFLSISYSTETKTYELRQELINKIYGNCNDNTTILNEKLNLTPKKQFEFMKFLQPWLKYLTDFCYVHMRRGLLGFLNPKITHAEWLVTWWKDIIYTDNSKQYVHIFNRPLFQTTYTMDKAIGELITKAGTIYRPLVEPGYNTFDRMIADFESIHKTYTGTDEYGDAVIYVHPKQKYRTIAQSLDGSEGRIIHEKPLWKQTQPEIVERRINCWYLYSHNIACFLSQYLSKLAAHHGVCYVIFFVASHLYI